MYVPVLHERATFALKLQDNPEKIAKNTLGVGLLFAAPGSFVYAFPV